ncbi:MAG: leucine-rich repeat domain-containing protein [Bacteroidales bacterium]|nr:leucine-rich repeat domain-containing protein [Bacteroidales bacterium]
MKRFTQKFFLLAMGLMLSVGANAQGDGIKHRFPQVNYTMKSSGKTIEAFVPAWDINMYNSQYPGCLRLQITEVIHEDLANKKNSEYNCKIVYRLGILSDLSDFNQTSSSTEVTYTGFSKTREYDNDDTYYELDDNGNPIKKTVTENAGYVQYSDYIDINTYDKGTWFEGTDYKHQDYDVFNYKTSGRHYVYGDYVIPETYECDYGKFHITDIDMFAFRNNTVDKTHPALYWFRPTSVTIPATINSIGYGAFLNNTSTTTITFDSKSPIKEIPPRTFMNCAALKTVTLPASVDIIWGASFGGCTNLEKIIFTGEKAPELKDYTHTNGQNYNFITATSTTFPGLTVAKCIMEVPLHSAKKYAEKDDLYKQFVMSSKFPIKTSSGMTSFCSDHPFTFNKYDTSAETPSWNAGDVKAYYVTASNVDLKNSNIELTEITGTGSETKTIPLENPESDYGFGVILKGETGNTYDIFYPNNLLTNELDVVENLLQGVNEPTPMVQISNFVYYALSGGKFHPVQLSDDPNPEIREKRNTIGAHKAFLMFVPKEDLNYARELTITLPEATGIVSHETKSVQNNVFYNLQGVQVKNPGKGVFIKNGKKFIIK